MSRSPRVGIGTDLHRLTEGRPLRLGTVAIDHRKGLAGHSDGDVVCHAVADALLGAAGLGEIGSLFPDTDPVWEGMTGTDLLEQVADLLRRNRWRVGNIDCVIQAEEPRLAPHRKTIVEGIARALSIPGRDVSVKIKSNEGLDAVGCGEAIASLAIARIEPEKTL